MPGASFADPIVVDVADGSLVLPSVSDEFGTYTFPFPLYIKIINLTDWTRYDISSFTTNSATRWTAYRPIAESSAYQIATGAPYNTSFTYGFRSQDDGAVILRIYNGDPGVPTTVAWTVGDTAPVGPYRPDLAIGLGAATDGSVTYYGYNPEVGQNFFTWTPPAGTTVQMISDTGDDYFDVYESTDGNWTNWNNWVGTGYLPPSGSTNLPEPLTVTTSGNTYWIVVYPSDYDVADPSVPRHLTWESAVPPPYVVSNNDLATPATLAARSGTTPVLPRRVQSTWARGWPRTRGCTRSGSSSP